MPRGANQKLKLLYLKQFFEEHTDEEHPATMQQMLDYLKANGVDAERKSIYTDFQDMEKFGIEVIKEQIGRETYYHVGVREFELAEVKFLIDTIQCAKFITERKSRELIKKIKRYENRTKY
jgi:hypothetical protein